MYNVNIIFLLIFGSWNLIFSLPVLSHYAFPLLSVCLVSMLSTCCQRPSIVIPYGPSASLRAPSWNLSRAAACSAPPLLVTHFALLSEILFGCGLLYPFGRVHHVIALYEMAHESDLLGDLRVWTMSIPSLGLIWLYKEFNIRNHFSLNCEDNFCCFLHLGFTLWGNKQSNLEP